MSGAHLYLFSDGCPTDWLEAGHDERWHTIVYFAFQSDPSLQGEVEGGTHFHQVLAKDLVFCDLFSQLTTGLPDNRLKKWKSSDAYKRRFIAAMSSSAPRSKPMLNAYSFQEKTLRQAKAKLLAAYNRHGRTERDIGFGEESDGQGRKVMTHEYVDFHGYHKIQRLENQMLVLLLMAWAAADQYRWYYGQILGDPTLGFDRLALTVVSDKLSGDTATRDDSARNLRMLIDPYSEAPIVLTRSPDSDAHPGDLLVDNMAGWLNACMCDPLGEYARAALQLSVRCPFAGWHEIQPDFTPRPAIARICGSTT
jgi:hypothetical protein